VNESIGVLVALTAGLLSFLSPCVLPLVPSYLCFVTGMTLDDLQGGADRKVVLVHAALFVIGFSVVFILLGASAFFLGAYLRAYKVWLARAGGVLLVVFGLHLIGLFRISALLRERRIDLAEKPAGKLGTIAVGAAFAAGWTPCIGPVLGGILTLGIEANTVWRGMGLLTAYSAGLAIPFFLAALALERFLDAFRRFRRYVGWVEKISGVLLIVIGFLLVSGQMTVFNGYLDRLTPEFIRDRI
jgi:cytochrome c-type biogenesis protein